VVLEPGVILYHAVRDQATAETIFAQGFRDARGYDSADRWWRGVWLFDLPLLDTGRGRVGAALLIRVDVPQGIADAYESVQQHAIYREWLIPADILNQYPRVRAQDPSKDL
jgi:hypothetical protein